MTEQAGNDTVYGLPLDALPEGSQPLDAIVIVTVLEGEKLRSYARYTDGMTHDKAIGQLVIERRRLLRQVDQAGC